MLAIFFFEINEFQDYRPLAFAKENFHLNFSVCCPLLLSDGTDDLKQSTKFEAAGEVTPSHQQPGS